MPINLCLYWQLPNLNTDWNWLFWRAFHGVHDN